MMKRTYTFARVAVLSGWFLILIAAAVFLPCVSEAWSLTAKVVFLALLAGWVTLAVTSLSRYFYRSWRRVRCVENSTAYLLRLSAMTLAVGGMFGYLAWALVMTAKSHVTPIRESKAQVLRQDLFEMRSLINEYTIEEQKPLRSLNELVEAGYMRSIPVDPMTGRNDTWVLIKCTDGMSERAIVDVDSGSRTRSEKFPFCD